jgi:hypothetical protein
VSTKKPATPNEPAHEPLLRVQLTIPRSLCWMLTGALLGHLNDVGPLLHGLGRLLL